MTNLSTDRRGKRLIMPITRAAIVSLSSSEKGDDLR